MHQSFRISYIVDLNRYYIIQTTMCRYQIDLVPYTSASIITVYYRSVYPMQIGPIRMTRLIHSYLRTYEFPYVKKKNNFEPQL